MRTALATLIASGGGFCVTKDDAVLAHLSLPVGGLMSDQSPSYVADRLRELRSASHSVGCILPEPFLQLAFLSLPVIPDLKLTDHGLVDVRAGKIISVVL
jgi:adenine deaminase